jgi:hypothetical protein
VPGTKLPHDYFSIGPAEVLVKAGKKDEGEKILNGIIDYAGDHIRYIVNIRSSERFDLDTEIQINWQSLYDIYIMSDDLKLPGIKSKVEPILNDYYRRLFPQER